MKDKIISTLIILAVICGVGYYIYDKTNYEGNSIVDVDVEPEILANYYIGNAYIMELEQENTNIFDLMDLSEASYFGAKISANSNYEISQLPKSEYDIIRENTVYKNSDLKGMDKAREYFLKLFNTSYEDIEEVDEKSTIYNTSLLDNIFINHEFYNVQNTFKSYFNGNIDDVFINNEVVLTCDDVQFSKICFVYAEDGFDCEDMSAGNYVYLIGNANVNIKTSNYEETREVKIKTLIQVIDSQALKTTFNYLELK